MGKKGDLSDFERGMVVGARVSQKLLIYKEFHTQPSLVFTENGSSVAENGSNFFGFPAIHT